MWTKENNENGILKDFVFKTVFGKNESKKLLDEFLERLLDREVKIEQMLNGEISREMLDGKNVNLDVAVKTADNTLINH
jgi:hypothetical protein